MFLRDTTISAIEDVICFVVTSPWKDRFLSRVEGLRREVDEPCVLAVAGRVKAGKSTLINALLGQKLSLMGVTETAATINYFRYDNPEDSSRLVCCVWLNGRRTWETKTFLDSLQGTSDEALAKAENISHLEFYLPHPDLCEVTLVYTPGYGRDNRAGRGHPRVSRGRILRHRTFIGCGGQRRQEEGPSDASQRRDSEVCRDGGRRDLPSRAGRAHDEPDVPAGVPTGFVWTDTGTQRDRRDVED